MNEKIKELFEKAHDVEKHTLYFIAATMEPKQASREEEFSTFNPETFAELIIRECIKIADNRGAYEVIDDIIDHFGVKE